MIVVTISSHTVSCSQGGSAHLGVGVIAITTLCTATSSIAQELVAHRRMSKVTCLTLFTILTVTSHIKLADRQWWDSAGWHRFASSMFCEPVTKISENVVWRDSIVDLTSERSV